MRKEIISWSTRLRAAKDANDGLAHGAATSAAPTAARLGIRAADVVIGALLAVGGIGVCALAALLALRRRAAGHGALAGVQGAADVAQEALVVRVVVRVVAVPHRHGLVQGKVRRVDGRHGRGGVGGRGRGVGRGEGPGGCRRRDGDGGRGVRGARRRR